MHYLSVDQLSKTYADKPLFERISFHINEGDKVALVALNGSGKSTLLRIITGEEIADEGEVRIHKDVQVLMLGQDHHYAAGTTVAEAVFELDHPQMKLLRKYESMLEDSTLFSEAQKAEILAEMDELDVWAFEAVVRQILDKLKIRNLEQAVDTMSGGERKRIALAQILIGLDFEHRHTLLILDEPTNHLDVDMIEWLEYYLAQERMTLILVTHDRYFLDNVCNRIIELDDRQLYFVQGNYEKYLEQKAIRQEQTLASIDKARNRYRKELEWMRKQPKARTTKSKSRQDAFYDWKEKALQKVDTAKLELNMKMTRLGGKVVEIKKLYKSYGDKVILKGFDYTFKKGERVGIVGRNGAGKSTFINMILGKEEPDSGKINVGDTVVFGDFSQEGLEIKEDKRVIEYVKDIAEHFVLADGTKVSAAQFLQKFLFGPEKQYTFISKLSGGEKKRLQLLSVLFRNPNVLVLDEPTNDLDLPTLDILEEFLQEYPGCILIVSHDRYFMDKIVDHLFVFEGEGKVRDFPGNYSLYRDVARDEERARQALEADARQQDKEVFSKEKDNKPKKLSYKEKRELEAIDKRLPQLQSQKQKLEAELSSGELSYEELNAKSQEVEQIIEEIDQLEMRWLELSELAE